jgi:hypothetical protein
MSEYEDIECECGLLFSCSKYYNDHLEDVANAKKYLASTHGMKKGVLKKDNETVN